MVSLNVGNADEFGNTVGILPDIFSMCTLLCVIIFLALKLYCLLLFVCWWVPLDWLCCRFYLTMVMGVGLFFVAPLVLPSACCWLLRLSSSTTSWAWAPAPLVLLMAWPPFLVCSSRSGGWWRGRFAGCDGRKQSLTGRRFLAGSFGFLGSGMAGGFPFFFVLFAFMMIIN